MQVVTEARLPASPEAVWPLLCSSKMDTDVPCLFRFGVPKPVECRLPDGVGAVGGRRQCVSDRGTIQQRITHWESPRLLRFHMEDTNLRFRTSVTSLVDEFSLVATEGGGTVVTRKTTFETIGFGRGVKALVLSVGLKAVHRYVFRNWARLLA